MYRKATENWRLDELNECRVNEDRSVAVLLFTENDIVESTRQLGDKVKAVPLFTSFERVYGMCFVFYRLSSAEVFFTMRFVNFFKALYNKRQRDTVLKFTYMHKDKLHNRFILTPFSLCCTQCYFSL